MKTKPINAKPINVKPINTKPINTKPINAKPINVKADLKKYDAKVKSAGMMNEYNPFADVKSVLEAEKGGQGDIIKNEGMNEFFSILREKGIYSKVMKQGSILSGKNVFSQKVGSLPRVPNLSGVVSLERLSLGYDKRK